MKRIQVPLTAYVLVEDDAAEDTWTVTSKLTETMMRDGGAEVVSVGRTTTSEARHGVCKVGPHDFYVDHYFPADRPVPDICRSHAYTAAIQGATDEHLPFFAEVERLTELSGEIWQSGGMTMTIVVGIPNEGEDDDAYPHYPCYMGLKEVDLEDGRWSGSLAYIERDPNEHADTGEVELVDSWEELTPQEWAAKLAAHYATIRKEQS